MEKTMRRFRDIASILAELNAEGLCAPTVNGLLTMYVGAASQRVLHMSFVPEHEARTFDNVVIAFWSQLTKHLDVAIVSPLSSSPALIAAARTLPSHMAKRGQPCPVLTLETTSRPGYHAKKFISNFMKDADNPPLAIRDTWSAVQSVLHSAISKQQLTATAT